MSNLDTITATQLYQRSCRHSTGCSNLCLAPTGRSGNISSRCDHLTDSCCRIQCTYNLFLRELFLLPERYQHRRQHSAGTRCRGCDNSSHTRIGFSHTQSLGDHFSHKISAQRFSVLCISEHPAAISSHKATVGPPFAVIVFRGLHHNPPHSSHFLKSFLWRHTAFILIVSSYSLPELPALLLTQL